MFPYSLAQKMQDRDETLRNITKHWFQQVYNELDRGDISKKMNEIN
jgi:hypothetical protein